MNKILQDCSVNKTEVNATKKKILSQIDSVYLSGNENGCKKYKKIVSYDCIYDTTFGIKARLAISVKNKCQSWEHFYFNDNFTIVKVIHELPPIY